MTAQAYVEHELMMNGVRIHLAESHQYGTKYVARFEDVVMAEHDEPAAMVDDPKPLRLSNDQARALYEALARHFDGAPDMAVVRADLNHERNRVDRLIGFLEPRREDTDHG